MRKSGLIMGVVNITPDSFSDGGRYLNPEKALEHAERLIADGADIIDCGAVSSRPGALSIPLEEEKARLLPFLKGWQLRQFPAWLSVDTSRAEIMRLAADHGANMVNDISGVADEETLKALAPYGLHYVAMHMKGTPQTMQQQPMAPLEAKKAVREFFTTARRKLADAGFADESIWLDPGIGFGKSDAANWALLEETRSFAEKARLIVGISRKGFLGRFFSLDVPEDRDAPSKMLELGLLWSGATAIRTHDVAGLARLRNQTLMNGA